MSFLRLPFQAVFASSQSETRLLVRSMAKAFAIVLPLKLNDGGMLFGGSFGTSAVVHEKRSRGCREDGTGAPVGIDLHLLLARVE